MKKITVTVFLVFITLNSFAQVKFSPEAYSYFGIDQNIFRAPEILQKNDGTYYSPDSIILSDQFFDLGYDLTLRYKSASKKHKFKISHDLWTRNYLDSSALNQYSIAFDAKYTYKINKDFLTGAKYGISQNKKIGTTVLGSELTLPLTYLNNKASAFFSTDILDHNETEISLNYFNKKYEKSIDGRSLDHNQVAINLVTAQDLYFAHQEFKVWLDVNWADRNYETMPVIDSTGRTQVTDTRHWRYFSTQFTFKLLDAGMFSAKVFYRYKVRKDLFEGYFSYNSSMAGIKLYLKKDKFLFTMKPQYTIRNYTVKEAPNPTQPDIGLVYKYLDFDAKLEYEIKKGLFLQLFYELKNRDTNTEDDGRFTRRPYNSYRVYGGIMINPMDLFKSEKINFDVED